MRRTGRSTDAERLAQSFTTLTTLVSFISRGSRHVPYRDSKLTYLLKDCLAVGKPTVLLTTVSPAVQEYQITLSAVKYAVRTKFQADASEKVW